MNERNFSPFKNALRSVMKKSLAVVKCTEKFGVAEGLKDKICVYNGPFKLQLSTYDSTVLKNHETN